MWLECSAVSGLHARIQNKEGSLLITDLDSTNGTYINEKRVPPGVTEVVPAGSLLTFGDTNLAIFRVSKIEKTIDNEAENSEEKGTEVAAQPETTS
ncbi:Zeaxanthin epoxidase chloroplastic [Bienertia sinuspersici]